MNTPMNSFCEDRGRWPKITVAVWLLLVSALTIINSVGLSRVIEQTRTSVQDAHVQVLAARVGELERQVEAVKRQPKPITQADLDSARQALDGRLSHIEQAQAADTHGEAVQALQVRVGAIEARLKKTPPATVPHRTADAPKPKALELPFNVVGLELRGGERFLSIASPGAVSLHELRLLREGEAIGAWQLQTIEAHAAVFRAAGQTQRIALP